MTYRYLSGSTNTLVDTRFLFWIGGILFCLIGTVAQVPSYSTFLLDSDHGHFLIGGALLHRAGDLPYADYLHVYGPFAFLPNGLAQSWSGGKLIGEVILVVLGFTAAYLLLFALTYRLTRSRFLSFAIVFIALTLFPRFYKYYIVLVPFAVLFVTYVYIESPTPQRAIAVGGIVAMSWLFRHDLGVYSGVTALVAWLFSRDSDNHFQYSIQKVHYLT